ncbi:MSMEG_0569 family flavin-dependent oxidoreductase [Rhodobacterales bacterium]|nr:MSMEG_0569 family flavin-dependent oxidoreductase [Rhodobacterales bacterium]
MTDTKTRTIPVVIVGGGQAGLSASYHLCRSNIEHVVLERYRFAHQWRENRWDSFCLVTPNWQCRLPGFSYGADYGGADPNGFMLKDEIVDYLEAFVKSFDPPLKEGVTVTDVRRRDDGRFVVETETEEGDLTYVAEQVVIASGGYDIPVIPPYAAEIDPAIVQIQAGDYRNPDQLPDGSVLVVGSGQSGVQIMEDLKIAGRQVHLAVGSAPRSPREYRGRDATDWLYDMGHYALTIRDHPLGEAVKEKTNHYMTGRDGGHEIDLRKFALEGVRLYGSMTGASRTEATFASDLEKNLDDADASYVGIREVIDRYIAENGIDAPEEPRFQKVWRPQTEPAALDFAREKISAVVWAIGFRPDYSWLNVDVLNDRGRPVFDRGVCEVEGIYFLGLGWLNTWGSGRFLGVAEDAEYLCGHIEALHRRNRASLSKVS